MTVTALEIQEIRFSEAKKGYDPVEVDEFLERVATDVDTLNRALSEAAARIKSSETRIREAETRAEEAEERAATAQEQAMQVAQAALAGDSEPAEAAKEEPHAEPEISEQDISNAFIAAQRSADALKEEARKEADKVYREAESKGRDIVREALAEKQKTLGELDRLRESCETFRTEYLSMLKHFQSDAQKRLHDFDEIVPAKPSDTTAAKGAEKATNITRDNDAAVKAPSSKGASATGSRPSVSTVSAAPATSAVLGEPSRSPIPEAMAPTIPAAGGGFDDIDDIDIEEID